jgi:phosphonate transport system ATP-binding protein
LGIVCVLHQPELALRFADRIVGIRAGEIAFDAHISAVSTASIATLYAGSTAA